MHPVHEMHYIPSIKSGKYLIVSQLRFQVNGYLGKLFKHTQLSKIFNDFKQNVLLVGDLLVLKHYMNDQCKEKCYCQENTSGLFNISPQEMRTTHGNIDYSCKCG